MKQTDILLLLGLGIGLLVFMKKATAKPVLQIATGGTLADKVASQALAPGDAGYGWKYFTDGTAINPDGTQYYQGGQLIWNAANYS